MECTSLQPTTPAGCHAAYTLVLGIIRRHGILPGDVGGNKPERIKL